MWIVEKTQNFHKSSDRIRISQEAIEAIEEWAKSVYKIQAPNFRCCHRSLDKKFEIWNAKIPDKQNRKGKSGGFRLIVFFVLDECTVYLDLIERRNELGGKSERPKDQQTYNAYLDSLKSRLYERYENHNG